MDIKLHKQATTTPKVRAEVQAAPSNITDSELARQFNVSTATIRRWRHRDNVYDRPHTRHNLLTTLTTEQEEVLIAAREFLRLGLDNLPVVAREFLNPRLSRSGLHRMLKRHEVPTLVELARQDAGGDEKPRHKPFRDYKPGSCTSTSNTCLGCLTSSRSATCTSPSIVPRAGFTWKSGTVSPQRMRGRS